MSIIELPPAGDLTDNDRRHYGNGWQKNSSGNIVTYPDYLNPRNAGMHTDLALLYPIQYQIAKKAYEEQMKAPVNRDPFGTDYLFENKG